MHDSESPKFLSEIERERESVLPLLSLSLGLERDRRRRLVRLNAAVEALRERPPPPTGSPPPPRRSAIHRSWPVLLLNGLLAHGKTAEEARQENIQLPDPADTVLPFASRGTAVSVITVV